MVERILAAVDGSDHALKAVALAADLALRYGAGLTVLHVMAHPGTVAVPPGLEQYAHLEHVFVTERAMFEAAAQSIVDNAARRAQEEGEVVVDEIIESGPAAETIAAVARRVGADMVVLGSRGMTDAQGLLLGSVSHKVGHLAPCTVVTVK